jgi:hypothetical protein
MDGDTMIWVLIATLATGSVALDNYTSHAECLEAMEEYVECGPMWAYCSCQSTEVSQ